MNDYFETIDKSRSVNIRNLRNGTIRTQRRVHNYKSGSIYDGEWIGGFRHGSGIMKFEDGSVYEGEWYLGRAHGYGKFTNLRNDSQDIYEGTYVLDCLHGYGKHT